MNLAAAVDQARALTRSVLAPLRKELAQLPAGGRAMDGNLRLVERLGRRDAALSLLEELLHDPAALSAVARRSYRHVNHFDKIVLVDAPSERGYRLTLHLWCPPYSREELADELIHDHRFSFWSSVLVGTLRSENFAPNGGGKRFQQYRYVPEKRGGLTAANFYEFVGEATLAAARTCERARGEHYCLSYERIHRVQLPRRGMTCTLVLRGPREQPFSNVFNTTYPAFDTRTANRPFSVVELEGKLRSLAAVLGGGG